MKTKLMTILAVVVSFVVVRFLPAQDLGPSFKKIKDGIYVYAQKLNDPNCTLILSQDGVVLIDSGNNPPDSLAVMKAVKGS